VDDGAQYVLHAPEVVRPFFVFFRHLLHKGVCNYSLLLQFEKLRLFDISHGSSYARYRKGTQRLTSDPKGIRGWSFAMQNSFGSQQHNQIRQTDWEVAVPVARSPEVFRYLRSYLNGKEPGQPDPIPMPTIGVYIRFSRASESLISHAAIGGDIKPGDTVMFIEIPEFLPIFNVRNDREEKIADAILLHYEAPLRGFVMEMMSRFGARVHWAKNRLDVMELQKHQPDRAQQLERFARQMLDLDPQRLFGSRIGEAMFYAKDRAAHERSGF
jgi:hypothetical protein